jgi:pyridoxine 4-dehydrogenase
LAEKFSSLAQKKKCTSVQLVLAWLLTQSDLIIPIPGSTRAEGVQETLETLNLTLSDQEVHEIREFVDRADFKGLRYGGQCFLI